MKRNRKLIVSLLGGAMLALPITAMAFAQSSYNNTGSGYVQQVDWWWDHYRDDPDEYSNHGWHRGYYEYGGQRHACERARRLQRQVWDDRRRGHPAAANDVEHEAAEARARCYNR